MLLDPLAMLSVRCVPATHNKQEVLANERINKAIMDLANINVAGMTITMNACHSGISFKFPKSHARFESKNMVKRTLHLYIQNRKFSKDENWEPLFNTSTFWELWHKPTGYYLFIQSNFAPPERHILVDKAFQSGLVFGEFFNNLHDKLAVYPLLSIEINLFINWLANHNDLILHAVGVIVDGSGFTFVGPSGVGKSTLASALLAVPGIEILGEDNIILRYREGQFWIYGTPWHQNPQMCSANFAPLKKIYFLDRTLTPGISHCPPLEGVIRLLQTAFIPYYRPETLPGILERLQMISQVVPFAIYHYLLGSDLGPLFSE